MQMHHATTTTLDPSVRVCGTTTQLTHKQRKRLSFYPEGSLYYAHVQCYPIHTTTTKYHWDGLFQQ